MYNRDTVYVLGAGASWHYGYPTGEALIHEMRRAGRVLRRHLELTKHYDGIGEPTFIHHLRSTKLATATPIDGFNYACAQLDDLENRLRASDPLVIDYFLGHNPNLADLGKLLIAWVLHEREFDAFKTGRNPNRNANEYNGPSPTPKDNWVRFVTSRLTSGCSSSAMLLENKIRFVTFNYDFSLERELFGSLIAFDTFSENDINNFLGGDRVTHVYGNLSGSPKQHSQYDFGIFSALKNMNAPNSIAVGAKARATLDALWDSGSGLRIIDPFHKEVDNDRLVTAKNAILDAETLYILGYGFDANNNKRIGLDISRHQGAIDKTVLFTNFASSNRVSKITGKILLGDHNAFLNGTIAQPTNHKWYREMSVKNTYDALMLDFDDA